MDMINLEKLIIEQNPHWQSTPTQIPGVLRDCFSVFCSEVNKSKLIVTLNGPRRSGKTFLLKQSLAHLITKIKIPAQNILYFQFSANLSDKTVIHDLIDLYLKKYATTGQKYLYLDEVQYIDYWQDQIKHFYDNFSDLKIIISGSTSLFYHQKSHESLAGRVFKFQLGALNFHEYLRFKKLLEPSTNRAEFVSQLSVYQSEFPKYLSTGQYPELLTHPDISPAKYITDLADQIINFDIPFFLTQIDRSLFYRLIKILSHDLAEEYSANNLAKTLETDRRIVTHYVKILEEIGLFKVCYNSAFQSFRKKLVGIKKVYALNLNLALHLNGFDESYFNDTRIFGKYLENYCFIQLNSKYKSVEYYRFKGKEIDFVTESDTFEVKSTEEVDTENYQLLSQKLHKNFHLLTPSEIYLL